MKKWSILIFLLILTACNEEENAQNTSIESNATSEQLNNEEQSIKVENVDAENTEQDGFAEDDEISIELEQYINELRNWQSFKSNLSYVVDYSGDKIDTEQYVETQSIDSSNQVFVTSHYIGFQNDYSEHFANRDLGGFENIQMNGWEEIDDYEYILKPSIPAKMEFLLHAMESAEWISKDDEFYQVNIGLKKEELQSMFEKMQASIFYKATESETSEDMLEIIRLETFEFENGFVGLKIGEHILEYIAEFEFYDETGELGKILLKDEFSKVNTLDATDIPEGLF